MSKVTTCLWFNKDAEAAARFYTSLVPNSKVTHVQKSTVDYPGGKIGDVITVEFTLDGAQFLGLNGGSTEIYSNASSIMVSCDSQAEIDRLWDALLADGGKPQMCGWLNDRWGVTWQVFPRRFMEITTGPDPVAAKKAMEAMMQMVKFDLAKIEEAVKA